MPSRPDGSAPPSRAAYLRARVFALLQFSTAFWACAYFALVAISGHTYFRSLAFGLAAAFALWLVLGSLFSDNEPMPVPDGWLLAAIAAWAGWSAASVAWSISPAFSLAELGTEVGWGLATAGTFYVAARAPAPFRAINATAIAVAAFLSVLAVQLLTAPGNAGPEVVLQRSHAGVGAFSTLLVLVVPLLPLLVAPRPVGFGAGPWQLAAVAALFALLLVAARLTENRMIWVALAAGFVVAALLAAWRWRERLARAPLRWAAVLLVLLVALGALFVDAARERARADFNGRTDVARALADDPRLLLWQHTFERIRERPWTGFGFGKSILREQLRAETGHPLLLHAHNLFVSQWLQTGAVGVATLLALLAALAWRYWIFLRAADGTLAAIGLVGLVMLATFLVKNLTDDFMVRPTSKEFWALSACLVGYGMRRMRVAPTAAARPAAQSASE